MDQSTRKVFSSGRLLQQSLLFLSCIAGIYLCYVLAQYILLFLDSRSFVRDAIFYWAVGKGMTNGLTPYSDLFEMKPPGIFILSAISFKIFGSQILGNILGVLALVSAPLIGVFGGRRVGNNVTKNISYVLMFLGFLSGGMWSLFLVMKAGPWQTELIGSLFAIWYVCFLYRPSSWRRTIGMSFALLCAVGLKEPFLLSCLGAAIITAKKPRELVDTFVIPTAIAGIIGLSTLFILGILDPYVSVYLPILFGFRLHTTQPILLRLFGFSLLAKNLWHVSVVFPFVAFALVLTHGLIPVQKARADILKKILQTFLGLLLAVASIGLAGDFQAHHFGFFTPFFVALVLGVQENLALNVAHVKLQWILPSLLALLVLTVITLSTVGDPRWAKDYVDRVQSDAKTVDAVLTACSVDRYLEILGTSNQIPVFAFTHHSPMNQSVFLQIDDAFQYGQKFLDESFARLSSAQIIVFPKRDFVPSNDIGVAMAQYIGQTFTQSQPDCVPTASGLQEYGMLFRYDPKPFNMKIRVQYQ